MPDTPTPGQVAYAAYCAVIGPHLTMPSVYQIDPALAERAWEAAAQAVLAQEDRRLKSQEDSLTLLGEARPFFEDAFAGVLEGIELRPLGRSLRVIARVASNDLHHLNRCLRVFDETWWLANCHRSNGLLMFDYETTTQPEDTPHA